MNRELKSVNLEVWSDCYASFFMALSKLKNAKEPDLRDVKTLLDAIHWEAQFPIAENEDVRKLIQNVWVKLKFAGSRNKTLNQICGDTFNEFIGSPLGISLSQTIEHCSDLKRISENKNDPEILTKMAALSFFMKIFSSPSKISDSDKAIEVKLNKVAIDIDLKPDFLDDGRIKIASKLGEQTYGFYTQDADGKLNRATPGSSFDFLDQFSLFYIQVGSDEVCRFEQIDDEVFHETFTHARIENGQLIRGVDSQRINVSVPVSNIDTSDDNPNLSIESINYKSSALIEFKVDENPNFGMHEDVALDFASNPQSIKNKIIMILYKDVSEKIPEITKHTACVIVGYFLAAFGLLDSEKEHDLNNKRKGTYHSYLFSSVKNTLNSKV